MQLTFTFYTILDTIARPYTLASLTGYFSSLTAVGHYMAVTALAGRKKDIGRLKLFLPDLQPQSNFCLLFDYRLAGDKVGKLRVFVKNSNNALAWEETGSEDERWKTGKIHLYQGIGATKSVSGKPVFNEILTFFFSDSANKTKHSARHWDHKDE